MLGLPGYCTLRSFLGLGGLPFPPPSCWRPLNRVVVKGNPPPPPSPLSRLRDRKKGGNQAVRNPGAAAAGEAHGSAASTGGGDGVMLSTASFWDEATDTGLRLCITRDRGSKGSGQAGPSGAPEHADAWRRVRACAFDPNRGGRLALSNSAGGIRLLYADDAQRVEDFEVYFGAPQIPGVDGLGAAPAPKRVEEAFDHLAFIPGRPDELFVSSGRNADVRVTAFPFSSVSPAAKHASGTNPSFAYGSFVLSAYSHDFRVRSLTVSGDGSFMASGDEHGLITVTWIQGGAAEEGERSFLVPPAGAGTSGRASDPEADDGFATFSARLSSAGRSPIYALSFLRGSQEQRGCQQPTGGVLASGSHDGRVDLWSFSAAISGEHPAVACSALRTLNGDGAPICSILELPGCGSEGSLAAGTTRGTLFLWDCKSGALRSLCDHTESAVVSLASVEEAGEHIIAAGDTEGSVRLYAAASSVEMQRDGADAHAACKLLAECSFDTPVLSTAFSEDRFLLANTAGALRVWNVTDLPYSRADRLKRASTERGARRTACAGGAPSSTRTTSSGGMPRPCSRQRRRRSHRAARPLCPHRCPWFLGRARRCRHLQRDPPGGEVQKRGAPGTGTGTGTGMGMGTRRRKGCRSHEVPPSHRPPSRPPSLRQRPA